MTEAVVFICPNPKCQRYIEEPILLTVLSVTPPEQYEACPYCFTKLESKPSIEQDDAPEPSVEPEEVVIEDEEVMPEPIVNNVIEKVKLTGPQLLKKVKSLLPNSNGIDDRQQKKPKEPQVEPAEKEQKPSKKKHEPEPSLKKEGNQSCCPESFGYLANRPTDTPIPQECLLCTRMVDCMLQPKS